MRHIKILFAIVFLSLLATGCTGTTLKCKPDDKAGVLEGTDTAVVGLYIDKKGYPQSTVQTVIVAPGQRIVFVGPRQFEILFKNKKSPVKEYELKSRDGVLVLDIPKDVFAQEDRDDPTNKEKNEISYMYGIRVNGRVTDPEIIVRPR